MVKKNLQGARFGQLTVLEDSGQRHDGCVLWRCRCDCGGEVLASTRRLNSGRLMSCGCVSQARPSQQRAEDLTGQTFGELTALYQLESTGGRTQWMCRCSCGRLHPVRSLDLKKGKIKSCGCRQYSAFKGMDLTGRRFDRVLALYPVRGARKGSSAVWHCRCDCGKEFETNAYSLLSGLTRSCGCLVKETGEKLHTYLHLTDGTCVERLVSTQSNFRNNTSGFRGVYPIKRGIYRAVIQFQKKRYDLGCYKNFNEAVRARLEAEDSLHAGFVRAYRNYQAKADGDPQWAIENPFFYYVEYANREFKVETNAGI